MRHMEVRGLPADDVKGLPFTAPDGGVLRYSNWFRRAW